MRRSISEHASTLVDALKMNAAADASQDIRSHCIGTFRDFADAVAREAIGLAHLACQAPSAALAATEVDSQCERLAAMIGNLAAAIRHETLAYVRENAKSWRNASQEAALQQPWSANYAGQPSEPNPAPEKPITLCAVHARFFANNALRPGIFVPWEAKGCCDWW